MVREEWKKTQEKIMWCACIRTHIDYHWCLLEGMSAPFNRETLAPKDSANRREGWLGRKVQTGRVSRNVAGRRAEANEETEAAFETFPHSAAAVKFLWIRGREWVYDEFREKCVFRVEKLRNESLFSWKTRQRKKLEVDLKGEEREEFCCVFKIDYGNRSLIRSASFFFLLLLFLTEAFDKPG